MNNIKQRIVMDEETKKLLSDQTIMPPEISIDGQDYILEECKSTEGYKSVLWKGMDKYNVPVAIKFTTYKDYVDHSYLQELSRAAHLRGYSQFAQYSNADIQSLHLGDKEIKCVCFAEEWVDGQTILQYAKNNLITVSFILQYIKEMCNALNIL